MRNTFRLLIFVTVGLVCARAVLAQIDNKTKSAGHSVHEIVKNANRMLSEGQAQAALEAYQEAERLLPDSPEIAFGRGLAYYRLKQMEEAREAFRKAQTATDPSLSQDAKYSLATCDHAEALQSSDDPKGAITKLESAMQQYHDVLSANPKHEAAKDANLKAAASWRQLKQLLQQQQQQQQQDGDKNNEDQQENQDQQQNSSKDQQEQDHQKKDQQQQQEGEKQEQSQKDQQQSSQEQKDQESAEQQEGKEKQEKKQSSTKDEQKEQKQTEAQEVQKAEEKEKSAHEQAQRRLREMIQSMQQRKRGRAQPLQPLPPSPTGKDW